MPRATTATNVRLGLFVSVGLGCLLVLLFLLGRKQSMFSRSIAVQADFRNVSGLIPGNNVRMGGITVGTVKEIRLINDTTVRVLMRLNSEAQPLVHQNAVATIGTDGLVGNTIVNLNAGRGTAPPVAAGDMLQTRTPMGIDAMLGTLDISNRNLVAITSNLREITGKLNAQNGLWTLLDDQQLTADVRQTLHNAASTSAELRGAAHDAQLLTQGVRQGHGVAGYLLTDTALAGQLRHAGRQLATSSDLLVSTLAGLKRQTQSPGPLHTVLADTAIARQLRQSMDQAEKGTADFSRTMDALQHNFLVRGYLRRQKKREARKTANAHEF